MAVKVVFVGNVMVGDDGIGPRLFNELKGHPSLADYVLLELGTSGVDLISFVQDRDRLILVDALRAKKGIGKVVLLEEGDLSDDMNLVSLHDFGIEQTAGLLRLQHPHIPPVRIVAVKVKDVQQCKEGLSRDLMNKMPQIRKEVLSAILKAAK
jgi:hydrogenase maturation protease